MPSRRNDFVSDLPPSFVELRDDALRGGLRAVVAQKQLAVLLQPLLVRLEVRRRAGDLLALRGRDGVGGDVRHVDDLLGLADELAGRLEDGLHVLVGHADLDELRLDFLEVLVKPQRVRAHTPVRLQPRDRLVELLLLDELGGLGVDLLFDHGPLRRVDGDVQLLDGVFAHQRVDVGVAGGRDAPEGLASVLVVPGRQVLLDVRTDLLKPRLRHRRSHFALVQFSHKRGHRLVNFLDPRLDHVHQAVARLCELALIQVADNGSLQGLLDAGNACRVNDLFPVPLGFGLGGSPQSGQFLFRGFLAGDGLYLRVGKFRILRTIHTLLGCVVNVGAHNPAQVRRDLIDLILGRT